MESRFSRLTGSLISGSGLLPRKETGRRSRRWPERGSTRATLGNRTNSDRRRRETGDGGFSGGSAISRRKPNRLVPLLLAMDRDVLKRSVVIWVRKRRGDEPG